MRYMNRQNMSVINISQEELDEFVKKYKKEIVLEEKEPDQDKFYTPLNLIDSLASLQAIQDQLDKAK